MRWIIAALFSAVLFWPSQSKAWSNPGHATVCQIAYERLTDTARTAVDNLVRNGPWGKFGNTPREGPYPTFAQACTFPDNPHDRDSEHYVNYDRALRQVTQNSLCAPGILCIYSAIDNDLAILTAPWASDIRRGAALFYLGHWVGDLHQPLHVSFEDDRGGSGVRTTGVCGDGGLHSVWDRCIVERVFRDLRPASGPLPSTTSSNQWSNARIAGTELEGVITAAQAAMWLASQEPWQWAAESWVIALRPDVQYCFDHEGQECWYGPSSRVLTEASSRTVDVTDGYVNGFKDEVTLRLQQAGVRLAHVLNTALDPVYHP
ncbi:MAG TPA: S1/P1 nuclease [Allosphingosinicella sp.]|nr:S1/P1 nuclease [Allosphingosinicella sp.]